jgi:hypothetical protein
MSKRPADYLANHSLGFACIAPNPVPDINGVVNLYLRQCVHSHKKLTLSWAS